MNLTVDLKFLVFQDITANEEIRFVWSVNGVSINLRLVHPLAYHVMIRRTLSNGVLPAIRTVCPRYGLINYLINLTAP